MSIQKYPEPTVGALIFNTKGKFLLVKSHKWHGKYVIPGGHIELGESLETALKREILEETGLVIFDLKFISFQEFIYDDCFWKKRHFIFFDFACKTTSNEIVLNDEAQEYLWVSFDEAKKLQVESYTSKTIAEWIKKYSV